MLMGTRVWLSGPEPATSPWILSVCLSACPGSSPIQPMVSTHETLLCCHVLGYVNLGISGYVVESKHMRQHLGSGASR